MLAFGSLSHAATPLHAPLQVLLHLLRVVMLDIHDIIGYICIHGASGLVRVQLVRGVLVLPLLQAHVQQTLSLGEPFRCLPQIGFLIL